MSSVGMHPGVFYGERMLSIKEADHMAAKETKKDGKKGCPKKWNILYFTIQDLCYVRTLFYYQFYGRCCLYL